MLDLGLTAVDMVYAFKLDNRGVVLTTGSHQANKQVL